MLPIHTTAVVSQDEKPMPLSPVRAAAQERLVTQNTELAGFVAKLSEEKMELRNALKNLEEQVADYRDRERTTDQVGVRYAILPQLSSFSLSDWLMHRGK